MAEFDEFPLEEPTDEARRVHRKKTPGAPSGKERLYGLALTPRAPSSCPIRTIDDIPERFRKPAKPPGKR